MIRMLAITIALAACSGTNPARDAIDAQTTRSPDAADGAWTCPMHPEVSSDQAGKCPMCGMDLVRRTP